MECFRCRQPYNRQTRRPKVLPCGHTYCLPCLETTDRCFSDAKEFSTAASSLADDLFTLSLVEKTSQKDDGIGPGLRLWCEGCAAEARELCLEDVDKGHKLVSMRRHWHDEVLRGLEAMSALAKSTEPEEHPVDSPGEEDLLAHLATNAAVKVTFQDGEDTWTATVQLGGSCREDSDEADMMRQLLLELRGHDSFKPAEPEPEPYVDPDPMLSFFDILRDSDEETEEEGCGEGKEGHLAAEIRALCEEEEDLLDLQDYDLSTMLTVLDAERLSRVRRLVGVWCHERPECTLQLLQLVSPHLEELELCNTDRAHLLAAHGMPRLRRLTVSGQGMWADPFLLPPLEHDGSLEHLQVCLCPPTVGSLVLAHQRTLRTVQLMGQLVPVFQGRRKPGPDAPFFEQLEYHGRGQVGHPVDGDPRRDPHFPWRDPGEFPVLESIEFIELQKNQWLCRSRNTFDILKKMFPEVRVDYLVLEKSPFRRMGKS